ncbi:proline imino-peptidase [Dacryopinax primogenitus]|uniref:Proline imino-peptidase n=1 Tax=Dacryopinax primogenitus (strain DJM 731) TaxID=1858805 RepID=M5GFE8_DACPD|nr:proline imino-peptidase [Dacryopinax primogenitus]EJU04093.1 proline imino-peptidase [Dacryopinax primogenitus]
MASTRTGNIPFREWETHYEIFGDLEKSSHPPLVVLHGGPGATYRYLLPIAGITEKFGIPVIFYDQLGCGESTHLLDQPKEFWSVDLFLEELDNVLEKLGIKDNYYLLGNSWGGMLGSQHAVAKPKGLKKLVLACTLPKTRMWADSCMRLRAAMPDDGGAKLEKHETEGTTDSAEYEQLSEWFDSHHGCRVRPLPEVVRATYEYLGKNHVVNDAMFGPKDTDPTGNIKDWSIIDRLHDIEAPTMVCHGAYDPADDIVVKPFLDNIPHVTKYFKFPNSSHMPQVEETELYVKEVGEWLAA